MDAWQTDNEYTEEIITAVKREGKGYAVETGDGWLGWDCDFVPVVGDMARYFGRGFGFPIRGIVCFPKQGGMPLVVRYQSPQEHAAERQKQSEEYERERAARVQRPSVEADGRVFDSEMGEISGFGGGYEETCRKMALAGMKWFDEHPTADPKFHGYQGITGIITEDNADAKALSDAIVAASGGDCSGAMHQACVNHALAYKRLGWDAYRAEMLKREAQEA